MQLPVFIYRFVYILCIFLQKSSELDADIGLWTFRSHALSFLGTKRPHSECSFPRNSNVWTFRSQNETAYSPSNFRALERLSKPNEEKE